MASNDLERDLTKASVGYLSKEDYKRKREEMESEKALAALMKMNGGKAAAPAAAAPASTDDSAEPPSEKKKKKKMKKAPSALSFGDELEAPCALEDLPRHPRKVLQAVVRQRRRARHDRAHRAAVGGLERHDGAGGARHLLEAVRVAQEGLAAVAHVPHVLIVL